MFGFLKSYNNEHQELYEYLTENWRMKPEYAQSFLDMYKRSIGKTLADQKKRMTALENSSDSSVVLMRYANLGEEYPFTLVTQAYQAYMTDLRRGTNVGTPVELAIWAILLNRSDLVEILDRGFKKYIKEKGDETFPNLFHQVFQYDNLPE